MANMSAYLEAKILTDTLGSGVFVALYRTNPTDQDTGQEVTGYTRIKALFSTPSADALMGCSNTNIIEFPAKSGGYGTITHIGLRDAAIGGNLLFYARLKEPISSTDEVGIKFEAESLKVSMD